MTPLRWAPRFIYHGIDFTLSYPVTRWTPGGRTVGHTAKSVTNVPGSTVTLAKSILPMRLRFTEDEWWSEVRDFLLWVRRGGAFQWYPNDLPSAGTPEVIEVIADAPRMADAIAPQRDGTLTWFMSAPLTLVKADGTGWDAQYFFEPPVLPTHVPTIQLATSGLLVRGDVADIAAPFSTSGWTVPSGAALSLVAGKLRASQTTVGVGRWITHASVAPRGTALVQMIAQMLDLGAVWGPIARATAGVTYADSVGGKLKLAFALLAEDTETLFEAVSGAVVQNQTTPGNQVLQAADHMLTTYVSPATIKVLSEIASFDKTAAPLTSPSALLGSVGFYQRSDFSTRLDIARFVACTDRYVTLTGEVTDGMVVKIRKADATSLASATIVSGVATLDMWGLSLDGSAFDIALFAADGVTLADVLAAPGGVWPGDAYLFA